MPNAHAFLRAFWFINLGLLIFNILPIYPLDGGQILRSLLWYIFGPIRSLLYATMVGFVGIAGLAFYALSFAFRSQFNQAIWMGLLTFYVFSNCRNAYLFARNANNPTQARP